MPTSIPLLRMAVGNRAELERLYVPARLCSGWSPDHDDIAEECGIPVDEEVPVVGHVGCPSTPQCGAATRVTQPSRAAAASSWSPVPPRTSKTPAVEDESEVCEEVLLNFRRKRRRET